MTAYAIVDRPDRDLLGEGPLWSARDNALYWVDIKAPRVNRLDLAGGAVRTWSMPEAIGWLIERRAGGFVAGFKQGFARLTLDPLEIDLFAVPEAHLPDTRMNDAKADGRGRIWAGSMDERDDAQPIGALRRLDPDFSWRQVDTGYHIANGPTFSPDQSVLYHADSARQVVYAYDVDQDAGTLANKRVFVQFQDGWGYPDGMTTDAEGGVWIAAWDGGRINRFTPEGKLDRFIALPASQITSCGFAGPELDRLFVTSAAMGRDNEPHAGALFEVDAGVRGLPPGQFGG
jgi:D-xylonolactonase